jgi:hypothetical protein
MTMPFKGFCFVSAAAGADKLTDIPRRPVLHRVEECARHSVHVVSVADGEDCKWMHVRARGRTSIMLTNLFSFCVLPGVQMATKEPVATLRVWMALICVSYDPADYWSFL